MLPFVQLGRAIDRRFNGGIAGFLGDQYNPFEVPDDPSSPLFKVRDLAIGTDAERQRLERRYAMLADLENYQKATETAGVVKARDKFYEKAHGIITGAAARKAFDLASEPDKLRETYGLDRPLHEQYLRYMWNALHGDFGISFQSPTETVTELIGRTWPTSISLGLMSLALAFSSGLAFGIIAALKQNSAIDYGLTFVSTLGLTVPNFVVAIWDRLKGGLPANVRLERVLLQETPRNFVEYTGG